MKVAIRIISRILRWEPHLNQIGLVIMSLLFAALPPVRLRGESSQPRILTLQQALEIAAEKNRDILKAREYRNYVMGRYREERAAALPEATASISSRVP